ncbi:hypothetical protein CRYUN_Cryun25bG0025000 [Craigia yunnanensis]
MGRATSISAWYQISTSKSMPGSLASGRQAESGTILGSKQLVSSLDIVIPEGHQSSWQSSEMTKEDDRIHNYQIPSGDCFAHLELQFKFYGLSSKVEGVLGRTYQPDFVNPAKPGMAMPVVGGEDKKRISSLLSADCYSCIFSPAGVLDQTDSLLMDFGTLDCTSGASSVSGIVCRR